MGDVIWPTKQNIAGGFGDLRGRKFTEDKWKTIWSKIGHPFVVSGFTITNPSGLNVDIAIGEAVIEGLLITTDLVKSLTLSASQNDINIWLRYTEDGNGEVNGVVFEALGSNGLPTDPSKACILGWAKTGATAITTLESRRALGAMGHKFTYAGDDRASREFKLGYEPALVIVHGSSTSNRYAIGSVTALAGNPGVSFSSTSLSVTADDSLRPEPQSNGFRVEGTAGGLNASGVTYRALAIG